MRMAQGIFADRTRTPCSHPAKMEGPARPFGASTETLPAVADALDIPAPELLGNEKSGSLLTAAFGFAMNRAYSFTAAFRASTRSVFSQATPRSSRPMWP